MTKAALQSIPPVLGKMKLQCHSIEKGGMKQSGRNELISKTILKLTGEHRTRKQISSHIQVINKFIAKDGEDSEEAKICE